VCALLSINAWDVEYAGLPAPQLYTTRKLPAGDAPGYALCDQTRCRFPCCAVTYPTRYGSITPVTCGHVRLYTARVLQPVDESLHGSALPGTQAYPVTIEGISSSYMKHPCLCNCTRATAMRSVAAVSAGARLVLTTVSHRPCCPHHPVIIRGAVVAMCIQRVYNAGLHAGVAIHRAVQLHLPMVVAHSLAALHNAHGSPRPRQNVHLYLHYPCLQLILDNTLGIKQCSAQMHMPAAFFSPCTQSGPVVQMRLIASDTFN
jgi:hypothetical protein